MKVGFLILTLLAIVHVCFGSPATIVGYGSSTSVITAKIQEGFYSGFQLGFEQVYSAEDRKRLVRTEQVHDGAPLGPAVSVQRLLDLGVVGLFGFPGSSDALIAARIAAKKTVLTVVPGCNHPDLGRLGPSVFSTGHSGEREMWSQLEFALNRLKLRRGLAIINPRAAPSVGMETVLASPATLRRFQTMAITVAHLDENLRLPEIYLSGLKRGDWQFLLMTPYPEACVPLVSQFAAEKIDIPVIASSAWGTVDSDVMRRYVADKRSAFYMLTSWLPGSPAGRNFRSVFRQRFAKEPTADSAYGYDVGKIAATTLRRTKQSASRSELLKAFTESLCFDELSVGRLCFPKDGGHAERVVHVLHFTKRGFEPVAEF